MNRKHLFAIGVVIAVYCYYTGSFGRKYECLAECKN